jgi:hypothetical protein
VFENWVLSITVVLELKLFDGKKMLMFTETNHTKQIKVYSASKKLYFQSGKNLHRSGSKTISTAYQTIIS